MKESSFIKLKSYYFLMGDNGFCSSSLIVKSLEDSSLKEKSIFFSLTTYFYLVSVNGLWVVSSMIFFLKKDLYIKEFFFLGGFSLAELLNEKF